MEVTIDKQYPIPASEKACWQVLSNITELATCMPGATITEQVDDTHYKGTVKVKVGPATASFAGDIEVLGVDEGAKQIRMLGKGADKGGSSASMELTASLQVQDDSSVNLIGKADVIVNGKFAQFGGRMMTSVSDMILKQFADNFAVKARAAQAALAPADATGTSTAAQSATGESATEVASAADAPKMQTELNGLAIAWMLIKNFFARLFGKSS
ncbi:MAG: SRPBCC family protein [Burkholderiaceae bacterium]|nr:SRPBCC family protein [Burkholderiaceae bacterium]MCD8564509.1 SRPBCC family protein [Burkholderiaceae bacterium]